MIPRWMHRLWAGFFGYFWLPCPRCGAMFGGHEVVYGPTHIGEITPGRVYKVTCPGCARSGVSVVEVTS